MHRYVLAVISGLIEEDNLKHNDAIHKILILHKYNGLAILFFFSGIVIWYWLRRKIMSSKEYAGWAIGVFIGSVLMLWQGYLGGEMVYNHGAGVKPMEFMMESDKGHEHKHGHEEKMNEEPSMDMQGHGGENKHEHKGGEEKMNMGMNKKDGGKKGMNGQSVQDTMPDKKQLKDMKY